MSKAKQLKEKIDGISEANKLDSEIAGFQRDAYGVLGRKKFDQFLDKNLVAVSRDFISSNMGSSVLKSDELKEFDDDDAVGVLGGKKKKQLDDKGLIAVGQEWLTNKLKGDVSSKAIEEPFKFEK